MTDAYSIDYFYGFSNSTAEILVSVGNFMFTMTNVSEISQFYLAQIGFFSNLFHILVLTRKSMRTTSVNIIMIGIGTCDFFNAIFILHSYVPSIFYGNCWNAHSYSYRFFNNWMQGINDALHRVCAWLAIVMALIRYLVIKNYHNPRFEKLTKPLFGVKTIIFIFIISSFMSAFYYSYMKIYQLGIWEPSEKCGELSEEMYSVTIDVFNLIPYTILDGFLKIVPSVAFPLLTFLLVRELRKAKKRRMILGGSNNNQDHVTKMVTVMTVSSILAEGPMGVAVIFQSLVYDQLGLFALSSDITATCYMFIAFNGCTHFIICLVVDRQYRDTARKVLTCGFCKRKKTKVLPNFVLETTLPVVQ